MLAISIQLPVIFIKSRFAPVMASVDNKGIKTMKILLQESLWSIEM
jgi:hypothetical protein